MGHQEGFSSAARYKPHHCQGNAITYQRRSLIHSPLYHRDAPLPSLCPRPSSLSPNVSRHFSFQSSASDSPELRAILNRAPSMRRRSASEETLNPPSPSPSSNNNNNPAKVNFTGRRAASYGMRAGRGGFSGSFDSRGSSVSSTPEGSTHNGVLYTSLPSQV